MTEIAVDQLELGPIGTNCYVVQATRGAAEAVVVDPSGSATDLRLALASSGARCAAILVTHGHFDHLLGLADLAEGTGAPVYAPRGDLPAIENPGAFSAYATGIRGWTPDHLVDGGEILELAGLRFEVRLVPGHSPGHVAFHADGALFSGDVLFAGSVGRTDLPGADWGTLLESIRSLVDAYPPDTIVYPGHGPSTTLGAELDRNPFLAELRAERPPAAGETAS